MKKPVIALAGLVFLCLIFILGKRTGGNEMFFIDETDTLRCAIALDHSAGRKRSVGFNYELLGSYAKETGNFVKIEPPEDSPLCWENLMDGTLDILVFDLEDTIPSLYSDVVYFSMPVKDKEVWAVKKEDARLLNSINAWFTEFRSDAFFDRIKYKYFRSYTVDWLLSHSDQVTSISPYDNIIKKYSEKIGVDWRLLSAIIYHESKFSMGVASQKSAQGLMQIKKSTAAKYGVDDLYNPDSNIKAGSMHFGHLIKKYRDEGLDSVNVVKFALAAYNAGEGNIEERRIKAAERGYDPNDWDELQKSVLSASKPTSTYIREVLETYEIYKTLVD